MPNPRSEPIGHAIRLATRADAEAIHTIYAPIVAATAISFELEAPSVDEVRRRIAATLEHYPWLVCAAGQTVLGYAYAGPHHTRAAYRWAADLSIYVDEPRRGRGVGKALCAVWLAILGRQAQISCKFLSTISGVLTGASPRRRLSGGEKVLPRRCVMKGMRSIFVAAALCLALVALVAAPAYASGGTRNQPSCPSQCPGSYPYQYGNGYPYAYQYQYQYQYANRYPYPYQYQYANRYPYPYKYQYPYQYQNRYVAPAPPPPPPPYAYYPPIYVVPGGVSTGYGNYTRCQQFGLHQANCFVPNASNSPNLGSIQMEPGIQIWGSCTAGQTMSRNGTNYQCSKTGAGWFPA